MRRITRSRGRTEERIAARGVRRSPFHDRLLAAGAVHGSKNGWERPNWFRRTGVPDPTHQSFERLLWKDTVGAEHRHVRNGVALIDMSSFTKFEISGPGACEYLNWLAAANLDKPAGAAVYTQLCNAKGGIEADLTIVRLADDRFYVVTGSGFGTRDGGWIQAHMPAGGSVRFSEATSSRAVLNLCGPLARRVLQKVTADDVSNAGFPYMSAKNIRIGFAPVLAVRITYVGELGWELHIPAEYAVYVFDTLLEAGQEFGIGHAGYRAIDSLRMEKRYLYWSADITPDYNPFEAGLGFAVALNKGDFRGRDALLENQGGRHQAEAVLLCAGSAAASLRRRDRSARGPGGGQYHQRQLRLHGGQEHCVWLCANRTRAGRCIRDRSLRRIVARSAD